MITGALKLFLRELPEPLFPFSCFDKFIAAVRQYTQTPGHTWISVLVIVESILELICQKLSNIISAESTERQRFLNSRHARSHKSLVCLKQGGLGSDQPVSCQVGAGPCSEEAVFCVLCAEVPDYSLRVSYMKDLVRSLPLPNHNTMELLFKHLRR